MRDDEMDSLQGEGDGQPGWWHCAPTTVEACISQLQWLMQRVACLEQEIESLKAKQSLSQLRKVEYKIGRLFVKDLSGTLSIGITSFGNTPELSDLSDLPVQWDGEELEAFNGEDMWTGDRDDIPRDDTRV
jgi:hypothetical protein